MFERETNVYAFLLGYLRRVMADVPDEKLADEPAPGLNPPLWILGHLAISNDFGLRILGKPPVCPEAWAKCFGRGSKPADVPLPHPTKAELMQAIERGHEQVTAAARLADPARLALPNPAPVFKGTPVETTGDLLALLMTGHFGAHIGQLSLWRRLSGLPHLF
jgi:hypothetical protein